MDLTELQKEAHAISRSKGWYDTDRGFGDFIALIHSELSEALEAYRERGLESWESTTPNELFLAVVEDWDESQLCAPHGVASELADVMIRVADMAEFYGVDLSKYNMPPVGKHPNRSFGTWIMGIHWYLGAAYQAGAYQWGHEEALDFPRGQEWVDRLGRTVQEVLNMVAHYGIDLDAAIEAKMEYNKTRPYRHGGKAL